MKAMVTGGNGFIGTHLVKYLLKCGYDVVVVDDDPRNESFEVPYYICDIRSERLVNVFQIEKPDIIFHLAAQSSVPLSMENPFEDAGTNVLGTVRLLENAIRHGVEKIIFASSAAVYGTPDTLPMTEEHALQPTSFYGLSKLIGEEYIRLYAKASGLTYNILRFANVYGSGQHANGGIITKMMQSSLENKPLSIYGDGTQTRDFIYVEDIAMACEKAVYQPSGIYNISNNTSLSINTLIKQVSEITRNPLSIKYTDTRNGDIAHSCLSNHKAQELLQWKPYFDIESGLKQTFESMEKYLYKEVQ